MSAATQRWVGRIGDDDGFATVLAAAAVAVAVALLVLGLVLAEAVVDRHRAESAADLAALAGASDAVSGTDTACGRADAVARANGGLLTSCSWHGWVLDVRVTRSCDCLRSVVGVAVGRARAGPAALDGDHIGGVR